MVEKLEQYKNWMTNLSFFGYHKFIIDNIENLWNLTNYIGHSYSKYTEKNYQTKKEYTSINLDETIKLAQQFLTKYNFNINIRQMLENGTLNLNKNTSKITNDFYGTITDGTINYDKNNKIIITINLEETIYDSIILIHELIHYLNQPQDKRNEVSDLLTEAISYGAELIFCEDLKNTQYENVRDIHFKTIEKFLYKYAYNIYYIYKIIYLYKQTGDITEEKYNLIFNDNQYQNTMQKFDEYVENQGSIFHDTWYLFGVPLAIYLLEEYRIDNNNIQYLHILNENINNKTLNECLKLIKIDNFDIFKEKIKQSTETYKQLLDEICLKENHKKRDDIPSLLI